MEGSGHEKTNVLDGRNVVLHIRSASIAEVFDWEDVALNPGVLAYRFTYTNIHGIRERKVIALHYSATLDIVACAPDENGLAGVTYDLLITTVPVNEAAYPRMVSIPPFSRGGFPDISDAILSVRQEKELQALETRFDDYFSETLFFPQVEGMSLEKIIRLRISTS